MWFEFLSMLLHAIPLEIIPIPKLIQVVPQRELFHVVIAVANLRNVLRYLKQAGCIIIAKDVNYCSNARIKMD